MNILQINASLFGDAGQSSRLADEFVARLWATTPEATVTRRDLASDPVPHLSADTFQAALTDPAERSPQQQKDAALADELVNELKQADVLVVGLPMYNFNVPSTLKAWFDHVARSGETFRYTANGPEGLLKAERAYVFAARGGYYAGAGNDFQTPYIEQFLGFLGIKEVEFVYAEGLAIDESSREQALAQANQDVARLAA